MSGAPRVLNYRAAAARSRRRGAGKKAPGSEIVFFSEKQKLLGNTLGAVLRRRCNQKTGTRGSLPGGEGGEAAPV